MYGQDDLDFAYASELAEAATFDVATAVRVFFDKAYRGDLGMAGTGPMARGRVSEFPSAAACVGKTLLVGGTTYRINNWQPLDDGAEVELPLVEA